MQTTVKDIKDMFVRSLSTTYDAGEVRNITDFVLEDHLGFTRTQLIMSPGSVITFEQQQRFVDTLKRLMSYEPVQYILGFSYFSGLKLSVNNDVLIPRPETEELVQWVLAEPSIKSASINILDIGTGSGCIALALKKRLSNAHVYAIDISEKAISLAKKNAQANNLNIEFIQADILNLPSDAIPGAPSSFDYIISNPPYVLQSEQVAIRKNVLDHEPHVALFVKDKDPLLFYKVIADISLRYLKADGKLFFEINEIMGENIKAMLAEKGFKDVEVKKDIFTKDRMIKAVIPSKVSN